MDMSLFPELQAHKQLTGSEPADLSNAPSASKASSILPPGPLDEGPKPWLAGVRPEQVKEQAIWHQTLCLLTVVIRI